MMKDRLQRIHARYYLAAGVALATLAVYLPALRNNFVIWDDDQYVLENPFIRSLDPACIKWAFTSFYAGNWHPLTWMSHALDHAVWGLNPPGHHLTSILLHALNTLLVVLLSHLLMSIGKERRGPDAAFAFLDERGMLIAAGVTGALFGLHPLHVESVAWVSERKDLLCGLFFLLSIMSYAHAASTAGALPGRHGPAVLQFEKRYLPALVLFSLALMSKPMAVSLPLILLLLDWYPLKRISTARSFLSAGAEKLPFVALSLISSVLTISAQRTASLEDVSLVTRMLVAANALIVYLGKMAVPYHLLPFYPYPDASSVLSAGYVSMAVAVCGITALCLATAGRHRLWLAAWGYYCITLLPVLGLVTVGEQSMADRYTYLPSLGPFLLFGLGMAWIGERTEMLQRHGSIAGHIAVITGIALILALSVSTLKQISHWRNGITLWTAVIDEDADPAPLAYYNRGLGYMRAGQYDRALQDYHAAIALDPRYVNAYTNRGLTYKRTGQLDLALADYNRAIDLDPGYAVPYNSRGVLFAETGRFGQAMSDFTRAISLRPDYANAYMNRGITLRDAGRTDEALGDFNAAIRIDQNSAEAYNGKGTALTAAGRYDLALKDYARAIQLEPSSPMVYGNRGETYERMGLADEALTDYNTALSLDANLAKIYYDRGGLFLRTGRKESAMSDYRRACELGVKAGCDALQHRIR